VVNVIWSGRYCVGGAISGMDRSVLYGQSQYCVDGVSIGVGGSVLCG
jgi:hypothetical protein